MQWRGAMWCLWVGMACLGNPLLVAEEMYDADPIFYSTTKTLHDPVAKLGEQLTGGEAKLSYDPKFGYLPALLKALEIPDASQVLVFSKTSLQLDHISPQVPRAVYFNEHSYVGFVRGGAVLEIASVDPSLGTNFYTLNQEKLKVPKIVRAKGDCLSCHASPRTRHVPGLLVRSVFPGPDGHPILRGGSFNTTHESPIGKRWGGWYVSGKHIDLPHMGNALVSDAKANPVKLNQPIGGPHDPKRIFDTSAYLRPTSDVAALMVLEHQALMQNILFEARYQTLLALRDQKVLDRLSDDPAGKLWPSIEGRIDRAAARVVKTMFFVDEAPIEKAIVGEGPFRKAFEARGPKASNGQSLHQLELAGRIFTYPLSFLIYSDSFDQLPPLLRQKAYRKLHDVLTGQNQDEAFAHIDRSERQAILRILRETKKGLPAYYQPPSDG